MWDVLPLSDQTTNIVDKVRRDLQEPVRLSPLTVYPEFTFSGQFLCVDKLNLQFMREVQLVLLCRWPHLTVAGWLGRVVGHVVGFDLCEIDLEVVELIGDTVLFALTLWVSARLGDYCICNIIRKTMISESVFKYRC